MSNVIDKNTGQPLGGGKISCIIEKGNLKVNELNNTCSDIDCSLDWADRIDRRRMVINTRTGRR